jgi:hypothetical protein
MILIIGLRLKLVYNYQVEILVKLNQFNRIFNYINYRKLY